MRRAFVILLAALTFHSISARVTLAEDVSLRAAWSRHFPGEPRPIYRHGNLDSFLRLANGACTPAVRSVIERLREYSQAGLDDDAVAAIGVRDHLRIELDRADDGCRQDRLRAYALGSIDLLTSSHYRHQPGKLYSAFEKYLPWLTAALLNHDRIVFLTPEWRAEQGGLWERRDSKNAQGYELWGAYACDPAIIYVDPSLPPYNFAATLFHELDHFMRDRRFAPGEGWRKKNGEIDWETFILADEAAAVAHSGLLQVHVRYERGGEKPMRLPGDLDLLTEGGPLERLTFFGHVEKDPWNLGGHLLGDIITTGGSGPTIYSLGQHKKLMGRVSDAYFPGMSFPWRSAGFTPSAKRRLQKHETPFAEFSPLYDWRVNRDWPYSRELPESIFRNRADYEQRALRSKEFSDRSRTAIQAIHDIDQLMQTLEEPSSSCVDFQAAIDGGKLSRYIGARLSGAGSRPSGAGSRPSGAGSRPSGAIRPCFSVQNRY